MIDKALIMKLFEPRIIYSAEYLTVKTYPMGLYKWVFMGVWMYLFPWWLFPVGLMLGFMVDCRFIRPYIPSHPGDLEAVFLRLSAYAAKSDNRAPREKVRALKAYLVDKYGDTPLVKSKLYVFRTFLQQQIDVPLTCLQINHYFDDDEKDQLMGLLGNLTIIDGVISRKTLLVLQQISSLIGTPLPTVEPQDVQQEANFNHQEPLFHAYMETPYSILGVQPEVGMRELKKAYHVQVKRYHPDMVLHLSPKAQQQAAHHFLKVQDAYEEILLEMAS